MAWVPLALGATGTVISAVGDIKTGKSAQAAADIEAARIEEIAGETRATAQRTAQEVERQGKLQQSRALAVAASSGAGASDPGFVGQMSQLAAETNYRKMVAMYEGESEAEQLELQAAETRKAGKQAKEAAYIGAASNVLSSGSSLLGKYG